MDHNITIKRGDTWRGIPELEILINDLPPGRPLTSAQMMLRTSAGAREMVMAFSTSDSTIIVEDANRGILSMPPRLMSVPAGIYSYDLEVTFADGRVLTVLTGKFTLMQDSSRNP